MYVPSFRIYINIYANMSSLKIPCQTDETGTKNKVVHILYAPFLLLDQVTDILVNIYSCIFE